MKHLLPGHTPDGRRLLALTLSAFGAGILFTFFLSPRALVLLESVLIIAVGLLLLTERP